MSDPIGGFRVSRYKGLRKSDGKRIIVIPDKDLTDEDGDTRMGDSTEVPVSLGGGISMGGKKFWELSIGDSGNIGDGGKTGVEMASEPKDTLEDNYLKNRIDVFGEELEIVR
ncbi:hypothetical protein Tco_0272180 [Tanacetum coccineum]